MTPSSSLQAPTALQRRRIMGISNGDGMCHPSDGTLPLRPTLNHENTHMDSTSPRVGPLHVSVRTGLLHAESRLWGETDYSGEDGHGTLGSPQTRFRRRYSTFSHRFIPDRVTPGQLGEPGRQKVENYVFCTLFFTPRKGACFRVLVKVQTDGGSAEIVL